MENIKVNMNGSYKLGLDEVEGLNDALSEALNPLTEALNKLCYWTTIEPEKTEYKRRDGFIPHAHNCGGLLLFVIVPKCEEYDFSFLDFNEYESICEDGRCGECDCCNPEHLALAFRVWLKFEGLDDGTMSFYLYASQNDEAPYFRNNYETDLFEKEFESQSLEETKLKASHAVRELMKTLKIEEVK